MTDPAAALAALLETRYGERFQVDPGLQGLATLAGMSGRGSHRAFRDAPVTPELIELLAAVAFAAPTKSDLQQRDLVHVRDPSLRAEVDALVAGQAWVAGAPELLIFCGANRRQRQLHEWRGHAFANDHLDAFFNAAVDAGIALAAFVTAAEAVGLGCCPISAVRNRAAEVSALLGLPKHVFPVAGLAVGWPAGATTVSLRLPMAATVHVDRYDESGIEDQVAAYDARRAAAQPYARQRAPDRFGESAQYGWSEDKARQYALPERDAFGAYVRDQGFDLS